VAGGDLHCAAGPLLINSALQVQVYLGQREGGSEPAAQPPSLAGGARPGRASVFCVQDLGSGGFTLWAKLLSSAAAAPLLS
jgi:hypothetical protein